MGSEYLTFGLPDRAVICDCTTMRRFFEGVSDAARCRA
jgi:hypothetical protein